MLPQFEAKRFRWYRREATAPPSEVLNKLEQAELISRAPSEADHRTMENRTSILIAHRLSTIRDSDLIAVMDQGQIVEQGAHEALPTRQGKYYALSMTQFASFAT